MGKVYKDWSAALLGFAIMFVASSAALAANLPTDNRITPIINDDPTKISFTDVGIAYTPSFKVWRKRFDSRFVGIGSSSLGSTFTLNGPGYDGVAFNGTMSASVRMDRDGNVKKGKLSIYSSDAMFDFGGSGTGLVFGADLVDFGWSGTEGILEFVSSNLSGWAADLWQNNAGDERLLFFTDPFNINKPFARIADGIAIVPVPAAVWLFGSGLLGLVGVARRKRNV